MFDADAVLVDAAAPLIWSKRPAFVDRAQQQGIEYRSIAFSLGTCLLSATKFNGLLRC